MGEAVMDPVLKGLDIIAIWTVLSIIVAPTIGKICGFSNPDGEDD